MARPAAFLDRDGTIIEEAHYLARPEQVRLVPGAAAAIASLNAAGIAVVVVTNQSGIARGVFDVAAYERVHARVAELLARERATIDASYYCPHHPDFTGPCDCRKPGVALYARAISDLGLDPTRSLFAGDRLRDVTAALHFGGLGILIPARDTPREEIDRLGPPLERAHSLAAAVRRAFPPPARSR